MNIMRTALAALVVGLGLPALATTNDDPVTTFVLDNGMQEIGRAHV